MRTVKGKSIYALLVLALIAGQIQYAYSTCFCTDRRAPVTRPEAVMQSPGMPSGSIICDECRGMIPLQHGVSLESPNCVRITMHTKSVVSSFTNFETFSGHFESGILLHIASRETCSLTSATNHLLLGSTDSPPLPLHITNLNFRI